MQNQEDSSRIYFKVDGKMYYTTWEDYQKIMNHTYPDINSIKKEEVK